MHVAAKNDGEIDVSVHVIANIDGGIDVFMLWPPIMIVISMFSCM